MQVLNGRVVGYFHKSAHNTPCFLSVRTQYDVPFVNMLIIKTIRCGSLCLE